MIELSAVARQGDSGGPILNQDGELAGVLFGAGWRSTSGSHVMRVKVFLEPVLKEFNSSPSQLAERSQLPSYRWQQTGSPQPLQAEEKKSRTRRRMVRWWKLAISGSRQIMSDHPGTPHVLCPVPIRTLPKHHCN